MVFKFFNSYISLYYIAFFKGHDHQTPFPAPYDVYPKLRCRHNDCMVDLSQESANAVKIAPSSNLEAAV